MKQYRPLKQQHGFQVIAMSGVMLVIGVLLLIQLGYDIADRREDAAKVAGVQISQFKNAVRAAIAREGTTIATGAFTGTNWLKNSGTCAGATGSAVDYLPCNFPDFLPLELAYQSTVNVVGTVVTVQSAFGVPQQGGDNFPYLSGIIVSAVNGASNDFITPVTQTHHVAENDVTNGQITMTVTNAIENNEYLRRDGTVLPTADFDWNANAIRNASELETTGDLVARGDVQSRRFVDLDDPNDIVDPSGRSQLETMDIRSLRDRDDNTFNWDGNGTSRMHYADLNYARLRFDYTEGAICDTETIGTTSTGEFMSCVNGIWVKPGEVQGSEINPGTVSGNRTYSGYTYCAISTFGNAEDSHYCRLTKVSSNSWNLMWYKTSCRMTCIQ